MTGPRCRARFDFEAEQSDELNFSIGDEIKLIERVSNEWLKGKLKERVGIFPAVYVEIVEDFPKEAVYKASQSRTVTTMYDFDGQEGELTFKVRLGAINCEVDSLFNFHCCMIGLLISNLYSKHN